MDTYDVKVDNFNKSTYDSFKIFLISNYNVHFFKGSRKDVIESLEIVSPDFRIIADFLSQQSVGFYVQDTQHAEFEKILQKIREISPNSNIVEKDKKPTDTSVLSKGSYQELLDFFDHVSSCTTCNLSFSKIWAHYTNNKKSDN